MKWPQTRETAKHARTNSKTGTAGVERGITVENDPAVEHNLRELRQMYKPHVQRLDESLLMTLPPWFPLTEAPIPGRSRPGKHHHRLRDPDPADARY